MNKKLETLKEVFENATATVVVITDNEFNILWTNTETLGIFPRKNIKQYLDFPPNYQESDNIIIPASIDEKNYSLNLLPVYDENVLVGYFIRLITLKELSDHQLNRDLNESQLEYFSTVRANISGIISCCMMLHETLEQHECYDELNILNKQLNYCYRLLSSLLNRSEVAKYSFALHNITKINVSTFLKDVIMIVNTLLRGTNISVTYNQPKDIFINIDADRFIMLILNMVINSIQNNIEEKKEITVTLSCDGKNALLTISDNGIGMNDETIQNIFSKAGYENNSTMDFDKKFALGYLIANYFCNAFDSTMYLSSKENVGTTISFKIPLANDDKFPDYVESKISEYLTNRFSNIYIALSQIVEIKFF